MIANLATGLFLLCLHVLLGLNKHGFSTILLNSKSNFHNRFNIMYVLFFFTSSRPPPAEIVKFIFIFFENDY